MNLDKNNIKQIGMEPSILLRNVRKEWLPILDTPELVEIIAQLPKNITPPPSMIFEFAKIPLKKIRIIIIGQDPYPKKGEALGVAFSSMKITPSLRNIFECLIANGFIKKMPDNGLLNNWVKQGILLLNTALTFPLNSGKSSHISLWKNYTSNIIEILTQLNPIFILWGAEAKKMKNIIGDCSFLEWVHPSPLAGTTFIRCDNFVNCNSILCERGHNPIDWNPSRECLAATDGSCIPNDGSAQCRGGFGVILPTHGIKIFGSIKPPATNNRAEGMAIYHALKFLSEHNDWTECKIIIDSKFWIEMLNKYMPKWKRQDFLSHKNPDITLSIYKVWKYLRTRVQLIHIKSHGKSRWDNGTEEQRIYFKLNDDVDRLAGEARHGEQGKYHIEKIR